jgi:hypothetical protein
VNLRGKQGEHAGYERHYGGIVEVSRKQLQSFRIAVDS